MKILALDLATETGYYVGDLNPSFIKFQKETRVVDFWGWITEKIHTPEGNAFDVVVIENAIGQRAFALEAFHDLKAVAKLACQLAEIPMVEYAPNHIKKVFTGNGGAKKPEIIQKCLDIGVKIPYRIMKSGVNKGEKRYNDNAADAVAIYHTYLINEGIPHG